jgi:hypothetical protein
VLKNCEKRDEMVKIKFFKTNNNLFHVSIPEGTVLTLKEKSINKEILKQGKDIISFEDGKITFLKDATILAKHVHTDELTCKGLLFVGKGRRRRQPKEVLKSFRSIKICEYVKHKKEVFVLNGFSPPIQDGQICVQKIGNKNRFYVMLKKDYENASLIYDTKMSLGV